MDGKDAGIIFESRFCQYLQRPQRIPPNRKLCSPVPEHWPSDDVFQHLLATPRVVLKLLSRQSVNDQVRVPVGSDFMTQGCHFPRQLGATFRQAPQYKKSCVRMEPFQQFQ